jgi:broad specificity phosphatase PhoE
MRRAILARHGESVFSIRGLLNGDPTVPGGLTEAGIEQARMLGEMLADQALDLCVTSELERTIATADEALRGRAVPRLVVPELDDPGYGPFEGAELAAYRAWAIEAPSSESPGEGGESRAAIVARYARAFRGIVALPGETILVVIHSLPIAYARTARDGRPPMQRMPFAEYATPYRFTSAELARVADVLEEWLANPTF